MKTFTAMIISTGLLANAALAETINFDDAKVGEAPSGWTATKTGSGNAKWTVEKDDTHRASRTSSSNPVKRLTRSHSKTTRA